MTMNAEDLAEDLNLGPTVLDDGAPGWAVLAGYIRDTVDLDEVEQLLVRPGDGPLGGPGCRSMLGR